MAEVASAFVSLLPSAKGFGSKLNGQIGGEVDKSGKTAGSRFGGALKLGAVAALGGAAVLGGFLKGSLDEAREAQKVGAQTNAVIKSTGGVANVTAKDVNTLSSAISAKSGIDDEAIASGANLLLTFTNVRNEAGKGNKVFDQTVQAATDMSVALGTDAKSAAMQLGKALNDPVKGVTKLQRSGVTFTDQQKKQIGTLVASGKTLQAQKIILGEVNKEFGGSAAAAATAGDKFKVAFGNLQESVGTALLPIIDKILGGMTKLATFLTNNVGPGIAALNGYLAPVVASVQSFFGSITSSGGAASGVFAKILPSLKSLGASAAKTGTAIGGFIKGLLPTIAQVAGKIGAAIGPALSTISNLVTTQLLPAFRAMLPVLLPVAKFILQIFGTQVVGIIHGFVQAVSGAINVISGIFKLIVALVHGDWSAAWSAVVQIVKGAFGLVIGLIRVAFFSGIPGLIRTGIAKILGLLGGLGPKAGGAMSNFAGAIGRGVSSAIRFFASLPGKALGAIASLVGRLATFAANAFRAFVSAEVRGIANIVNAARTIVGRVLGAIAGLVGRLASLAVNAFLAFLNAERRGIENIVAAARALPGKVLSGLGNVGSLLYTAGTQLIQGMINGVKAMAGSIASAAANVVGNAISAAKSKLGIHSPSRVFHKIGEQTGQGYVDGINAHRKKVRAAVEAMVSHAKTRVGDLKQAFRDLSSTVSAAFKGQLFNTTLEVAVTGADGTTSTNTVAGGLAGLQHQLSSDLANAQAFQAAFNLAQKKGLSGGLAKELAASGDTKTAQDIAALSKEQIAALEGQYTQLNKLTTAIGQDAATQQFGQQIASQNQALHRLNGKLDSLPGLIQKSVEKGARDGVGDRDKQTTARKKAGR